MTALAGSGVSEVAMTELDIAGGAASDFATAVKACLAVTACVGITVRIHIYTILCASPHRFIRSGVSATRIHGVQAPLPCSTIPTINPRLLILPLCQHWHRLQFDNLKLRRMAVFNFLCIHSFISQLSRPH